MNGPIRRLAIGVFTAMFALVLAVSWYQVIRADDLRTDPRNARPLLTERGKERGAIVTRDGTVVARSVEDPEDRLSFVRQYPEGEVFAHVVGYSSFLVGDNGLEAAYSSDLRSRRDLTISNLISMLLGRDPRPHGLELTIHAELQRTALEALGDNRGAVVALDPRTGAVLALVSAPSYNPEVLLGVDAAAQWEDLLAEPSQPSRDRATRELYAPGSTFKTVVAAAALEAGVAEPSTTFGDPVSLELPGTTATISNFGGGLCNDGRSATLLQGLVRSCNTVFGELAMMVGAEEIGATAEAMGFNRDLPFEWSVPRASWLTNELADDDAALAQSGIGERDVRAAPLHMAMVAAAVANDGVAMVPYLVQRIFDGDGDTVEETEARQLGRAASEDTAAVLTDMMEQVVTQGTGGRAAVSGVRVAGKTGTATGRAGFSNPWFIGFAPVEDPTIAVAVLVEGSLVTGESATGGAVAAPIASRLIQTWMSLQP